MSKSKGNLVYVSKLLEADVDAMAIRLALISQRYTDDRMWTDRLLHDAEELVERIRTQLAKSSVAPVVAFQSRIIEALADNLDTPAAISALVDWCNASESEPSCDEAGLMARFLDSVLGLAL
jgi:L-cysteine:1D-myo-inositol 2-amino-2-deoxy-alpha-D-glucopyranoside ligase